jgi:hypothetical protein
MIAGALAAELGAMPLIGVLTYVIARPPEERALIA